MDESDQQALEHAQQYPDQTRLLAFVAGWRAGHAAALRRPDVIVITQEDEIEDIAWSLPAGAPEPDVAEIMPDGVRIAGA